MFLDFNDFDPRRVINVKPRLKLATTIALAKNMPIETLAKVLGHSSLEGNFTMHHHPI